MLAVLLLEKGQKLCSIPQIMPKIMLAQSARAYKLPPYYRRYVDDTLTVMPDLSTVRDFLNTLNHAHPAIKITMEVENDGMLPFLGINS